MLLQGKSISLSSRHLPGVQGDTGHVRIDLNYPRQVKGNLRGTRGRKLFENGIFFFKERVVSLLKGVEVKNVFIRAAINTYYIDIFLITFSSY